MLQLTVKEFDQCYYYSGWSECIIETPSVFGRYVFLSLSTYFILISLPPFPLPEPSVVILYHCTNAIYAAYAHTLCTASRPEYIGSYQGANASIYWWGTWELAKEFIKKHMPPCTGIHPISTITCCDGIGCQKMKRRVVTSQAFIRSRCEILRCLFALSGAGFWKVLAGAQSQPQQSCLLHLPLPRPDSSGGSCCQRGHRRGYEGQEDQAGGDEQLPQ